MPSTYDTMFFVLGAQKAGTTWLHKYLSGHPQVSMGPVKEYSYFGYFHRPFTSGATRPLRFQGIRRLLAEASLRRRTGLRRGYFGSVLDAWRGGPIYKALLRSDRPGVRAFGDISPKYSLLGRSAFAEMASMHRKTKFVFIMREPTERLWSQIRMGIAKRKQGEMGDDWVLRRSAHPWFRGRSDYARLMAELEAAVPAEDILYLFYETLFTDASVRRLCDHLGIDFIPGQYRARVFEGQPLPLAATVRAALRRQLDAQYRAIEERFSSDLPPWSF